MSGPGSAHWVENRPVRGLWPALDLREIWTSRELSYFFFVRDMKVRYKQTVLGAAWVLLQPLMGAISFTFLFNGLAGIETEGSYFALALTGFVVWNYISGVIGGTSESLTEHEDLITHVAFPKIAAPMSTVPSGLVDLGVGSMVLVAWTVLRGGELSAVGMTIGVPVALVLMTVTALGPGLLFAPALVKYHDAGAVLGVLVQLMFLLGPVVYPADLVGSDYRTLQYLNPVTGCLALFRWGFTAAPAPQPGDIAISVIVAATVAVVGLASFRRNEHVLADVI